MPRAPYSASPARTAVLGAMAALLSARVTHADTVIPPGSIYTVTAASGFPDSGPVTVSNGASLQLEDSAGGFRFGNSLSLMGSGPCGRFSCLPKMWAVLANGHTITATGNISISGSSTTITTTGRFGDDPPNGTLELTGNISAAGSTPVSLTLGTAVRFTGVLSDGPTAPLRVDFQSLQTLNNANTHSGGTGGYVRIFSDSALGAPGAPTSNLRELHLAASIVTSRLISGGIKVVAEAGTSSVFSGPIPASIMLSGPGNLILSGPILGMTFGAEGSGTLFLRGSRTGPRAISLNVDGGTVVLENSDLLTGDAALSGGLGDIFVRSGTLRLAGTPQTYELGRYGQSGGTVEIRQTSATQGDSFLLQTEAYLGGTLRIVPTGGYRPRTGDRFTIFTAAGIVWDFDRIIAPPGFLYRTTLLPGGGGARSASFTIEYIALSDFAVTPTGTAVAQAIMRAAAAGAPAGFFAPILGASPGQIVGSDFDQLTPQRLQVLRDVAFDQSQFVAASLEHGRQQGADGWYAFASAPLAFGDIKSTAQTSQADYRGIGLTGGVGYRRASGFDVGALVSYQDTDIDIDRSGSEGSAMTVMPALFAGYTGGGLDAYALAGYSFHKYSTSRRAQLSIFDVTAQGETSGHSPAVSAGASYDLGHGALRFGPVANATYTRLSIDAFTEENGGDANLAIGALRATSFRTQAGAFAAFAPTRTVQAKLKLQWQHEFKGDASPWSAAFARASSSDFITTVSTMKGSALAGDVAVSAQFAGRITGFLGYGIQAGSRATAQRLAAGIRVTF